MMKKVKNTFASVSHFLFHKQPSGTRVVFLTQEVVEASAKLLASFGTSREMHEGIIYWAGVETGSLKVVTTVIAPEATTTKGSYRTSAVANALVIMEVNRLNLHILAQLHGHPGDWVDHSTGDVKGAFMPYPGYYSIVVPNYGAQGLLPLPKCGIHKYEKGKFIRLQNRMINQEFFVVPSQIDLRGKQCLKI